MKRHSIVTDQEEKGPRDRTAKILVKFQMF